MAHTPTSERRKRKREKAGLPPIVHNAPKSQMGRVLNSDLFLRSKLSEGEIAFLRFKGVLTSRAWIIDDIYRDWTKATFTQRANLKRMWDEGARRIKKVAA